MDWKKRFNRKKIRVRKPVLAWIKRDESGKVIGAAGQKEYDELVKQGLSDGFKQETILLK